MFGANKGLLLGGGGPLFQSATQCFPTLVRNPVSCAAGGSSFGKKTSDEVQITVAAGNCHGTRHFPELSTLDDGATAVVICIADDQTAGQATVVIGAVGFHAEYLAASMNGTLYQEPHLLNYTVSCTINISPAVGFRESAHFPKAPP